MPQYSVETQSMKHTENSKSIHKLEIMDLLPSDIDIEMFCSEIKQALDKL